jgi:hypothetical protein
MTQYSKAVTQMLKEGINVYTKSDGGVFVTVMGSRCFEIELSLSEIQKWADLYDDDEIMDFKNTDPRHILEEIARIFHYRGWDLGDSGSNDTDFIHSSDKYLELVYKAFNPINKK